MACSGAGAGSAPVDFQSAAASQVAAAAGSPGAATPGAAAGAGFGGGGQDTHRGMMRRFGADAIGSGQWFGDSPDNEVRGASPTRRRRDFSESDRVTESVSIDGEEHRLPPEVIGEGPR